MSFPPSMILTIAALTLLVSGCHPPSSPAPHHTAPAHTDPAPQQDDTEYRWLPPSDSEKFLAIEEQLQGYSRTMREVAYRHSELYFAGQDENWAYADYQLEHIAEAIEQGIARRPARGPNSRNFLDKDIPALQEAIDQKSPELFAERFEAFTGSCNSCHGLEDHGFIHVRTPTIRILPTGP